MSWNIFVPFAFNKNLDRLLITAIAIENIHGAKCISGAFFATKFQKLLIYVVL